ncbi:DUF2946 family protein [Brevundimonas sp. Root1279]|uniref:DUF2946 family protein n=1 Tax=Brevundimonas sp. Root1279 TaxID=1736443 RepID=UPI0006FB3805|nr:DUF2946 family protein [Brevundimonas sp. Root1279]KQW83190.1 hypothetical protein ASC65_07645 [Brevundimonas sp. Root1279]
MNARADNWSLSKSLAFLAAVFAITLGSLFPFAALAAVQPGQPLIICSAQGPMEVQLGGDMDGPAGKTHLPKCAACVMPLLAALPAPPTPEPTITPASAEAIAYTPQAAAPPPPARAPPRPPSTAPPHA